MHFIIHVCIVFFVTKYSLNEDYCYLSFRSMGTRLDPDLLCKCIPNILK